MNTVNVFLNVKGQQQVSEHALVPKVRADLDRYFAKQLQLAYREFIIPEDSPQSLAKFVAMQQCANLILAQMKIPYCALIAMWDDTVKISDTSSVKVIVTCALFRSTDNVTVLSVGAWDGKSVCPPASASLLRQVASSPLPSSAPATDAQHRFTAAVGDIILHWSLRETVYQRLGALYTADPERAELRH